MLHDVEITMQSVVDYSSLVDLANPKHKLSVKLFPGNRWIRMAIGAVLQNKTGSLSAIDHSSEQAITNRDDAPLECPEIFAIDLVFVSEQTNARRVVSELDCDVVLGLLVVAR